MDSLAPKWLSFGAEAATGTTATTGRGRGSGNVTGNGTMAAGVGGGGSAGNALAQRRRQPEPQNARGPVTDFPSLSSTARADRGQPMRPNAPTGVRTIARPARPSSASQAQAQSTGGIWSQGPHIGGGGPGTRHPSASLQQQDQPKQRPKLINCGLTRTGITPRQNPTQPAAKPAPFANLKQAKGATKPRSSKLEFLQSLKTGGGPTKGDSGSSTGGEGGHTTNTTTSGNASKSTAATGSSSAPPAAQRTRPLGAPPGLSLVNPSAGSQAVQMSTPARGASASSQPPRLSSPAVDIEQPPATMPDATSVASPPQPIQQPRSADDNELSQSLEAEERFLRRLGWDGVADEEECEEGLTEDEIIAFRRQVGIDSQSQVSDVRKKPLGLGTWQPVLPAVKQIVSDDDDGDSVSSSDDDDDKQ